MSQFLPENLQMHIYLLKSEFKDIEDALVSQNSELPNLESEYSSKSHEVMSMLQRVRDLNAKMERLTMENVQKTARRIQLKKQCDDLNKNLERVRSIHRELVDSLKQEKNNIGLFVTKYEDSLKKTAERFRQTLNFYNEEKVKAAINENQKSIAKLENLCEVQQNVIAFLKTNLDNLKPDLPDNLLAICGQSGLNKKINELMKKIENLMQEIKRNQ